jgi:hypothetical protein
VSCELGICGWKTGSLQRIESRGRGFGNHKKKKERVCVWTSERWQRGMWVIKKNERDDLQLWVWCECSTCRLGGRGKNGWKRIKLLQKQRSTIHFSHTAWDQKRRVDDVSLVYQRHVRG